MMIFGERGKLDIPEENLTEDSKEPTTYLTHIWPQVENRTWDIWGGRQLQSPLYHPCSPGIHEEDP